MRSVAIDLPAQDLGQSLSELARLLNIDLLFDRSLVAGKRARALRVRAGPEQALAQLLAGTGLTYRRSPGGAFLIIAAPRAAPAPPAEAVAPTEPVADILVVGRRTQNTDIRRTIDDIQPYQTLDSGEVDKAQPPTMEDFLRTRLTSQTQSFTYAQRPSASGGSGRSQIALRGLEADQTLVLVDGRRLPAVATLLSFQQPDINGLEVDAVDRVEVLGASAGGIFGIGAAGGAINVVLKRDYEGIALTTRTGITDRGDGFTRGAGLRVGLTSRNERTRVMVRYSQSQDDGLRFGDRDFVVKARRLRAALSPDFRESVASNSINFNSVTGAPLSVNGVSLNAVTTFLPLDAPALNAGGLALLKANAGGYDLSLSPDGQGALQSLLTATRTQSFLATVRHEFSPRIEAYVDLLWLRNEGRAIIPAIDTAGKPNGLVDPGNGFDQLIDLSFPGIFSPATVLLPGDPRNPFDQVVNVSFPTPGLVGRLRERAITERISAGLIARLGGDWSLNLDGSVGRSLIRNEENVVAELAVKLDPLLGATALKSQLAQLSPSPALVTRNSDVLYDASLRLAGPIFTTAAGTARVTAVAEYRRERAAGEHGTSNFTFLGEPTLQAPNEGPSGQDTASLFMEARVPLIAETSRIAPLRGLELQMVVRRDAFVQTPSDPPPQFFLGASRLGTRNRAIIYAETMGLSVRPLPGLMVRASYASGATPPNSFQLTPSAVAYSGQSNTTDDPKRGGFQSSGTITGFTIASGGSPNLRPQRTSTFAIGLVFEPRWVPGLRVSADYSRLTTRNEINDYASVDYQYVIDHEARFPGRVTRAPLTPEDVTRGYTGGVITAVDASYLQIGRSTIQTVDFSLRYSRATSLGDFHVYGQATWEPSFRRSIIPELPSYQLAGRSDGPLVWRANGGAGWARGGWSTDLDVQFYDSYRSLSAVPFTAFLQGILNVVPHPAGQDVRVPATAFVDWTLSYRAPVGRGVPTLEYRLTIKNLFDTQPPIVAGVMATVLRNVGVDLSDFNPLGGYSPYADPRGRRFVFTVTARF